MYILNESKYQITSRFKFFNKLLFNNSITENFEISTSRGGNSFILGVVATSTEYKVDYLQVKEDSRLPNEVLDAVLIHEMIHAYCIQQYGEKALENKGHNALFYKKRDELLKKFPEYPIPVKEDISSIESILDTLGL
jgi:hypothetical protein